MGSRNEVIKKGRHVRKDAKLCQIYGTSGFRFYSSPIECLKVSEFRGPFSKLFIMRGVEGRKGCAQNSYRNSLNGVSWIILKKKICYCFSVI